MPNMPKGKEMKIAITGTIGSGKTEVSIYLRKKGYDVFDCDQVNKEILDSRAYELLSEEFPECFKNKDLNKQKLADIVFDDYRRKQKLESILHPIILNKLLARNDDPLFAEVPLLFEAGWDKYFDEKLLIICDEDIALQRLENRGIGKKEAYNRIKNQMPVQEKIKNATRIIYNNGSLDELYSAIDSYLKDIC